MTHSARRTHWLHHGQTAGMIGLVFIAGAFALATLLALLGVLPWLTMTATFGEIALPNAGAYLQGTLTAILLLLVSFVPSARRTQQIETQQRDFRITMEEVAQAYTVAHAADREGAFTLSREFDDMRERINHLRDHPDLRGLEPEVFELAAQMSREAKDLAEVYSDEKVNRARTFLRQRQEELTAYRDQITLAQRTCDELKRWNQAMAVENATLEQSRAQLERDMGELLSPLGLSLTTARPTTVVTMTPDMTRPDLPRSATARKRGAIAGTGSSARATDA